jgi:hypothetical protein
MRPGQADQFHLLRPDLEASPEQHSKPRVTESIYCMDSIPDGYELHPAYPDPAEVAEKRASTILSSDSKAWLLSQGIPEDAMEGVAEFQSGLVLTNAKFHFVIDPRDDHHAIAVKTAFHVPVTLDGKLVDLVRFTRKQPRGFLQHGGRVCRAASWLGAPVPPGVDEDGWPIPTPVWRTPLAWLRAGCVGLCYLRLSWPDHRLGPLRDLPAVIAEDAEHAFLLDKMVWHDPIDGLLRPPHWARIPVSPASIRPPSGESRIGTP